MTGRAVIDLDRSATILDVADRLAQVPEGDDLVLVAAAGAPWLRSVVFIEVARTLAGERRLALVTSDARARSLAASAHVPAYASVTALDHRELDPTERLDRRRAAVARPARTAALRAPVLTRRTLGIAGSLAAALLVALAVVAPSAAVTVAPATRALGPVDFEIRAGEGAITQQPLSDTITAKVGGRASGSRIEETKAKGSVQLSNRQTRDIRIPRGTEFRTPGGVRFQTTEERTLPRSTILVVTVIVGRVDIPIEAVQSGTVGNVPARSITVGPSPNDYTVENPQATSGGETKRVPIVERRDYDAAAARVNEALAAAAETRLARWRTEARAGTTVVPRAYWRPLSVTPAPEIVGKETETFELTATGIATAFAVPQGQPQAAAIDRLAALTEPGFALDRETVKVDAPVLLDDPAGPGGSGEIVWKVRASGMQLKRVDTDAIRRGLAGRSMDEARGVLDAFDVRLVQVRTDPEWWPRLPVLDARIRVVEVPATATTP